MAWILPSLIALTLALAVRARPIPGALGVGIAGRWLDGQVITTVLAIQGFTTGILLGVFLLGILTERVRQPHALLALVGGLGLMTWVKFGTALAWPWFALVGAGATFAIGIIARTLVK